MQQERKLNNLGPLAAGQPEMAIAQNMRIKAKNKRKIIFLSIAIVTAIILAFTPGGWKGLGTVFTHSIYYFLWVIVGLLVVAVSEDYKKRPFSLSDVIKDYKYPILLSIILTTITFLGVGIGFRVLEDETNLVASSLSLHLDRTFKIIVQAHHYYDMIRVVTEKIPSRPALFPFSMNFLHSLFGYNAYHGFVVNFIAAVFTFLMIIRLGEKLVDRTFGVIAAVLITSFPLYSLVITSSGFDALNLFFHTVIFLQLYRFLRDPTALNFEILLLLEILGAQCRYETVTLLLPIFIAGGMNYKSVLETKISWRVLVIPLLFMPIVWQRMIYGTKYIYAHSKYYPQLADGDSAIFSVAYLFRNVVNAFEFFFNYTGKNYPTSHIVMALSVTGLCWLLFKYGRAPLALNKIKGKKSDRPLLPFIGLVSLGLAIMGIILLSYFLGNIKTPVTMRFGVVYLTAIVFLAAYPLYRLYRMPLGVGLVAIILIANFSISLSIASQNRFGKRLTLPREYERNLAFFKKIPKNGTLIISGRPGMYTSHRYGALNIKYANAKQSEIINSIKRGLYQAFVIQKIYYKGGKAKDFLDPGYKTEAVYEYQNTGEYFIRISRIVP